MSATSHRAQALNGTVRAPGDKSISHRSQIERQKDGSWTIIGCGAAGFKSPAGDVDCGNAGTGVRLIMGAASGYALSAL